MNRAGVRIWSCESARKWNVLSLCEFSSSLEKCADRLFQTYFTLSSPSHFSDRNCITIIFSWILIEWRIVQTFSDTGTKFLTICWEQEKSHTVHTMGAKKTFKTIFVQGGVGSICWNRRRPGRIYDKQINLVTSKDVFSYICICFCIFIFSFWWRKIRKCWQFVHSSFQIHRAWNLHSSLERWDTKRYIYTPNQTDLGMPLYSYISPPSFLIIWF